MQRAIVIVFAFLAGCAAKTFQESVVEAAKVRSSQDCKKYKGGCEFSVAHGSDYFLVTVSPVNLGVDGKRIWVPGSDRLYRYNSRGDFVTEIPDL